MKTLGKLILGIATIALTACGGGEQKSNQSELSGAIKIDGSSTVYPITEAVAEEFRVIQPAVNVTVGVSGTGGGFKKFMRGEIDINDASRPIKAKEATACEEIGIGYQELSVAYDGLAVLINPENDWVDYLTVEELKKIWIPEAQGKVMYWSDVREGWPKEELHLFGPGVASGTYDYFAEAICGKKVGTRGDYTASEDDHVLVQGIATDKNALGFFGLAYYEENKDKLKLVGVDNGNGVVMPSLETVGDGSYAPLSRPIFIYVSSLAVQKEEVKEFVSFYLESASSLVSEVGYIPLPDTEYAKEIEKFNAFVK
ncbi:MAG: PstS family phosphate ABC transporter substrate-binding protein [Flavobacteriales bacterium]|nr:PstS family phosphate ABC transporter substrate-binding protein [Flavobacteriales bacterium]